MFLLKLQIVTNKKLLNKVQNGENVFEVVKKSRKMSKKFKPRASFEYNQLYSTFDFKTQIRLKLSIRLEIPIDNRKTDSTKCLTMTVNSHHSIFNKKYGFNKLMQNTTLLMSST